MSQTKFNGSTVNMAGRLPCVGSKAPDFKYVNGDLSEGHLSDLKGKRVVINIFPSIDTGVCGQSVRTFNKLVSEMEDAVVLSVSVDLPFALSRFCGAEGIDKVITGSLFRDPDFGKNYGVEMLDGPLAGLMARSIVVVDKEGNVIHTELVDDITHEPNYDAATAALK